MLKRNVHVRANLLVSSNRVQQSSGNFVGIGVEEANPAQVFDLCQPLQQKCQAILQAELLAVAGRVLTNQGNFADTGLRQTLRLCHDRFKTPRAELSAQLRNNTKTARVIAALGDLDVSHVPRRRQDAWCRLVVKIVGQIGDRPVPGLAGKTALCGAPLPPQSAPPAPQMPDNPGWTR